MSDKPISLQTSSGQRYPCSNPRPEVEFRPYVRRHQLVPDETARRTDYVRFSASSRQSRILCGAQFSFGLNDAKPAQQYYEYYRQAWEEATMRRVKGASKRTRAKRALPLGVVGISLTLLGGTSEATANIAPSHEIILHEEEVFDVSLSPFFVFDRESAKTPRFGEKYAQRGYRGCRGCGGCRGFTGCSRGCAVARCARCARGCTVARGGGRCGASCRCGGGGGGCGVSGCAVSSCGPVYRPPTRRPPPVEDSEDSEAR